jgi:hypothetical protein
MFYKHYFCNIDEYLSIKTLAYFGNATMAKLDPCYHDKYYQLRKWMYVNDVVNITSARGNWLLLGTYLEMSMGDRGAKIRPQQGRQKVLII